ncbi:MAG: hypothetical protein WC496_01055 [Phycisphaerae bacterium]|jgi:hypothetical protein
MYRKIVMCLTVCVSFTVLSYSATAPGPNDYIIPGRILLFDGTLDGVRGAYQTFDNGINDGSCTQCQTDRELRFFHALSGTVMLLVREDGNSVNSIFELMQKFGIPVSGQYWAPYFESDKPEVNGVRNQHNTYQIPDDAPDINSMKNIIDASFIPEIEEIISELDSISDSPSDRFRIYISADELRIFYPSDYEFEEPLGPVEVDYAEVLLLKRFLTALKTQLEFRAAYDIYTSPGDKLFEKVYGGSFNINEDILLTHPEMLKVLPTLNDSNDGKAVLAQIRQDWIDFVNYYIDMVEYIRAEEDPQEDDFFYIDPNDEYLADEIENKLIILRDSLINDTLATFPWETTKTYDVYDVNSRYIGQLTLVYDITGINGESGSLIITDGNLAPSPWDVDWCGRTQTRLIEIDLEYYSQYQWGQGNFNGDLSEDGNTITNATFEYWGSSSGTIYNLSGQAVDIEVQDVNIDLNPIFGSTARYPNPVNPRDLFPEFDQWNGSLPGTVGHGLGDDPTLGGILPQTTQFDWQTEFDLQPGGLIYLSYLGSTPIAIDGNTTDWNGNQLIFNDISGDTEEGSNEVSGVDIKNLYMAYDKNYLYGAVETYDALRNDSENTYNISLSYSPGDSLYKLMISIYVYDNFAYGSLYYMDTDEWGWTGWQYITDFTVAAGQNAVEFKIPFNDIPDYLPGRFITIESEGWDQDWNWDGDDNDTHLRIGEVGPISGTVSYDGFKGDPIFVQAYTDPEDREESAVATTMITEPGPYTLEGIGIGWQGYVRAFTPFFGFENPFEVSAFQIQTATPVFMIFDDLSNIDISLNYPIELKNGISLQGQIDSETREVDWYYFDAVAGGTYTINLMPPIVAPYICIALYDRNARWELIGLDYWETQQIIWTCPESGRYYIEAEDDYYQPVGGTYQIQMTTDVTCPQADIACAKWVGVGDCQVDLYDLAVLVSHWLDSCSYPYWCDKADFDQSGSANFLDFNTLADEWMSMELRD